MVRDAHKAADEFLGQQRRGTFMSKPSIRRPPSYQEYATDVLANEQFNDMGLEERGLWHTMRLQCWANNSVPRDPARLARVLHLDYDAVKRAMTRNVMASFAPQPGDQERLMCPELEKYRAAKEQYRQEQSERGKKGAEATHSRRRNEQHRAADGAADDPDDIPF